MPQKQCMDIYEKKRVEESVLNRRTVKRPFEKKSEQGKPDDSHHDADLQFGEAHGLISAGGENSSRRLQVFIRQKFPKAG